MKLNFIIRGDKQKQEAKFQIGKIPTDELHEVIIRPFKADRTLAQNSLFHMWLAQISREFYLKTGKQFCIQEWKTEFKERFLGYVPIRTPSGKIVEQLRHTSKLNVKEFREFLENIDHYCGSTLEIYLDRPEDLYYQAVGYRGKA